MPSRSSSGWVDDRETEIGGKPVRLSYLVDSFPVVAGVDCPVVPEWV